MLVGNINCCVCLTVQNVYVMLLRAYRAAELCVNMLKDNIEMDSKEMELMTSRQLNLMNT